MGLLSSLLVTLALSQRPQVGPVLVTSPSAAVVPLTVKAAAGQASNIQEWKDNVGTVLASIRADGSFSGAIKIGGLPPLGILYADATGAATASGNFTYDAGVNNVYARTNLFAISGQTSISGILQLGGGAEFSSNPALGLSLANGVRFRDNAGVLEISQNGAAYSAISTGGLSGSGALHKLVLWTGTSALGSLGVATDGQIPIGSTALDPVLATITGTANRVTVTNGAGSITLSGPQDIGTGSSPTFTAVTVTGLVFNGQTVSKGAADSCGAGFACLRVPN